jgi:DNA polymerase-3 subunit delta'
MSILECRWQNIAILRLQQARRGRRVPHSYIFHGPDGVGKTLLACQWAKLQLCSSPVRRSGPGNLGGSVVEEIDDCCDRCDDCRSVEAGNHPDLHIINRDLARYTSKARDSQMLELPVDVIREFVIGPAGLAPGRGRARIFLVEQGHSMNRQAQNALLKTLEEPPANTFILLITSKPDLFLPTVRSRCQSIQFQPLPLEFVREKLSEAGVPDEQGWYWADFCGGRLGPALELAQMALYEAKCHLFEQLGLLGYGSALDLAAWIVDQAKVFGQSYLESHPGHSLSDATRQGQSYFLQMITYAFSLALRRTVGVGQQGGSEIARIAERFCPGACARAIRAACRSESLLYTNVNVPLLFESLMLDCMDYAEH